MSIKVVAEILADFDVDFHVCIDGRHKYSLQAGGFCRQIMRGGICKADLGKWRCVGSRNCPLAHGEFFKTRDCRRSTRKVRCVARGIITHCHAPYTLSYGTLRFVGVEINLFNSELSKKIIYIYITSSVYDCTVEDVEYI